MVKRTLYVLIALAGILLGAAGALTMVRLPLVLAAGVLLLAFFLFDYSRVTYVVAAYVVIDYVLRQIVKVPLLASSWDELLFVFAFMLWMLKWFLYRREAAYVWTPLDFPLIFFIGISIFLMLVNSPDLLIGVEGFRAVVEYMFFYFVAVQLFKNRQQARNALYIMLMIGCLIGLHGIYQYITRAPMPEGWMDRVESGVRARAFSIIGSPNILGSLMVLLIPVSLSLVFAERLFMKKLFFAGVSLVMTACLLFTQSRSALLGFAVAALLYVLLKDRRLIVPLILGGILAVILVPSVLDRFVYMLSPVYMENSMKAGRLIRWATGWEMFMENFWMGVGLGRFGGAVAMNHKDLFPKTFYMDNYMLKTAVEMGFIGVVAFFALLYRTLLWGLRGLHRIADQYYLDIARGTFTGLIGVIVHNFSESIFESPMMVTYFWLFAAIVMYLAYVGNRDESLPSVP